MHVFNAESPKQGSRRFNSIVKTKYIDNLGIVYLCMISQTIFLHRNIHRYWPITKLMIFIRDAELYINLSNCKTPEEKATGFIYK